CKLTVPNHPPVDLPPNDLFPPVHLQEQAQIQRLEEIVATHKRAIRLADSLIAMSGTDGYKTFVGAVDEIKQANYAKLMSAKTDRDASLLIGACRSLEDILVLMTSTQNNRARLAATLAQTEDHLSKLRNPAKREPL